MTQSALSIFHRLFYFAILYFLSSILSATHAQCLSYPLSGNLRSDEGTIEMWMRLEDEPDGSQRKGLHYFPMFQIKFEGEEQPRIGFTYQTIWGTNSFHFSLSSSGKLMGQLVGNPCITSIDETQAAVKADSSQFKYPRTARLHKGEWHHWAFTWRGGNETTVALYLDGKPAIIPTKTESSLWADVEGASLRFLSYVYHDNMTIDDFRISSVARTEKDNQEAFAKGSLDADRYNLLLDKVEDVTEGKETRPVKMVVEEKGSRKGTILANYVV